MQAYYLANSALFETNPTQAQINTAYAWVQENGGKLTLTQFESAFTSSTLSDRQAFFSAVQSTDWNGCSVSSWPSSSRPRRSTTKTDASFLRTACRLRSALRVAGLYLGVVALSIATAGTFLALAGAIAAVGSGWE